MKLDYDLMAKICEYIESSPCTNRRLPLDSKDFSGANEDVLDEHVRLAAERGYVHIAASGNDRRLLLNGHAFLTLAGHDWIRVRRTRNDTDRWAP